METDQCRGKTRNTVSGWKEKTSVTALLTAKLACLVRGADVEDISAVAKISATRTSPVY